MVVCEDGRMRRGEYRKFHIRGRGGTEGPANSGNDLAIALANLSEEHREVLLLRYVDGLALAEIAEAVEIPLGTVKSRLHNALEILRQDKRARQFFEE